jgi:4-amino-4-deoxychorismate lyase
MESHQYGEHTGRAILHRGLICNPVIESNPHTPFFNYGLGFFETILYENGTFQFYNEHLKRIEKTCEDFGVSVDFNEIGEKVLHKLIHSSGLENHCCRVKIIYAPLQKENRWDTVVTASPYTRPVKDFILSIHNEVYDSRLNRYKSLNYHYKLYWKEQYSKKDYSDEVLFCNKEGHILEGSYTNILYVKDSILFYVDKSCNYLNGIMQGRILREAEKLKGLGIQPLTEGIEIAKLITADEVMVSNSLLIVQNVRKILSGDQVFRWPSSPQSSYLADSLRDKLIIS